MGEDGAAAERLNPEAPISTSSDSVLEKMFPAALVRVRVMGSAAALHILHTRLFCLMLALFEAKKSRVGFSRRDDCVGTICAL